MSESQHITVTIHQPAAREAAGQANYFFSRLQLLFIGLKLAGYIAWSWWWVLSPFIGCAAIGLMVLLLKLLVGRPAR